MENKILGLHHITAIADDAQRNFDFYTNIMGLRLVKKTVNFDDPGTYHFYFGDEAGTPGTILTFFPWEGIGQGRIGSGMATHIGYAVPEGSLEFWKDRLKAFNISRANEIRERFGEAYLALQDPDGLELELIVPSKEDHRIAWETDAVKANVATKGFHNVTLTLNRLEPTAKILTDVLGYRQVKQEGNRFRFETGAIDSANILDIVVDPAGVRGHNAAGTNHHIAFRVANEDILMNYREKILSKGLDITPKIDRDYFFSLYFREPGGVLFELATDNAGFTRDEPLAELGSALKLPKQYEKHREKIEQMLPCLH